MDRLSRIIELVLLVAMMVMVWAAMLGIPLFLLYILVGPLFGPDPGGHLALVAKGAAWLIGICGSFILVVNGAIWLYARSRVVRFIFQCLCFAVIGLLALSVVSQCTDGTARCTPSRYIDC